MKKRTLKKLAVALAVGMLFSTTLVYGNQVSYSFTLNPTQTAYSETAKKVVEKSYVTITQTTPTSVIEYTVLTGTGVWKTTPTKWYGAATKYVQYNEATSVNSILKLKVCNYAADNGGAIRNASGNWIP